MHVAVASLVVFHISNNIANGGEYWIAAAVICGILICISTLFTKQHYIADIPAGVGLAAVIFWCFVSIY
jgi:membrane-associated phospholipid phosphatase